MPELLHSITGIDIDIFRTWTNIVFHGIIYLLLIALVFRPISLCKLFSKCNKKPWKAIIPVYNLILLYQIAGVSPWFILIYLIYPLSFNIAFIVQFLFSTYLYTMLAKKFNKTIGFTIGLILLPTIFLFILAFDKSNYSREK